MLVLVVDTSVLNVAIPVLIRDLGASGPDVAWILDSYILVFAGLLIAGGSVSDRYGRRRGLLTGLVIFGFASLAASFAASPEELIAARAVMGVGGALIMPCTLAILTTVFEPAERKRALAIWSSALVLGALAGPAVGGTLLRHFWWGSVFLLNTPVVVLGGLAALLVVPESRAAARRADVVGALLSIVSMTALVWAVISIAQDGWSSVAVLVRAGIAVFGAGAFVLWERRFPEPMLPLELFRVRIFNGASLAIVLLSFAGGGVMLALTQYLQFVLGFDPLRAGLALAPLLVSVMAFNAVGVVVDRRWGARTAVSAGLLFLAAGFGLLSVSATGAGYSHLVLALVVTGAGSGMTVPAAYGTVTSVLPADRAAVGSAVNEAVQQVGQALSVAVLGSVLTAAFAAALPPGVAGAARNSIGDALGVAAATGDAALAAAARDAFVKAMSIATAVAAVGATVGAITAFALLRPVTPRRATDDPGTATPAAAAVSASSMPGGGARPHA
ncbi:MFS transporter [Rugosimonospora africana]|uniref:MFS transporter n=1 Tax=Rugosimonospora africana TaxID=556532 RepID=A0A8J3VV60_9ACTN|nr:MFS transporter [Rugosimonospora africana]GIH19599.1 MFS transporter [Rugosimonospora africana]